MQSYALAIVGAEYVAGLVPRGTHDWRRFITPEELVMMAGDAGLVPVQVRGLMAAALSRAINSAWALPLSHPCLAPGGPTPPRSATFASAVCPGAVGCAHTHTAAPSFSSALNHPGPDRREAQPYTPA